MEKVERVTVVRVNGGYLISENHKGFADGNFLHVVHDNQDLGDELYKIFKN